MHHRTSQATAGPAGGRSVPRLDALTAAVEALVSVDPEGLDEAALRAELAAVERVGRRIQARSFALASTLSAKAARRAAAERPDDRRAPERAARDTQGELARTLRWSPSQAKQAVATGKQMATMGAASAAFSSGDLSADHVRELTKTLNHFVGDQRDRLETELVAAAKLQDPVAFGRTCRARLAEIDQAAAVDDERSRHGRRSAKLGQAPDGTTFLSARLSGIDAEIAFTAVDAFRRRDIEGEHRSAEQRTADALVAALRAALDAGDAPASHGVRPHVAITLDWQDLVAETGVAQGAWTGPLPVADILTLLDDAGVARILTDADSLPLDVGRESRTVPAGVWRAIVARDGTCTFEGCDAPAAWCDAAHLDQRWWQGAGTSAREQALACLPHHRKIDDEGWTGEIIDGHVVWHPPPTAHPGNDPP